MINRAERKFVAGGLDSTPWSLDHEPRRAANWLTGGRRSTARGFTLVVSDVAAFALAVAVAWATISVVPHAAIGTDQSAIHLLAGEAGLAFMCVVLAIADTRYRQRPNFAREAQQVLSASVAAFCLTGFLAFWTQRGLPRLSMAMLWGSFPVFALALRYLCRRALMEAGMWRPRVVVVGTGLLLDRGLNALEADSYRGYEIVDVMAPARLEQALKAQSALDVLVHAGADKVVLISDHEGWSQRGLTQSLIQARIPFAVMPQLDGRQVVGCDRTCFFSHDMVLLSYRNNLARPLSRAIKLCFDLVVACAILLFISPLFLLIALAVKLDGGPVFFSQKRVGANGRSFACFKFRSMVPNADAVLALLLETDQQAAAEWAETRKLRDDPRVTGVGKLLRMTSLDELPQLLNILKLEMSLVGPRPIVAAEVVRYANNIVFYHEARPGLTGLWQVSGRSDTSYERRVELDCWYVKNWSIGQDLAIIARTIPAVLKRSGAR